MLITFDKGGIQRQSEFGQPYQHKRFFEPPSGEKIQYFSPILEGSGGNAPSENFENNVFKIG